VSLRHSDAGYCGLKSYSISPSAPFLSLIGPTLKIESQVPADAGEYSVILEVSLVNYQNVTRMFETLSIKIECEVIQIIPDKTPQDITFMIN